MCSSAHGESLSPARREVTYCGPVSRKTHPNFQDTTGGQVGRRWCFGENEKSKMKN
jgi:hypothetical protein